MLTTTGAKSGEPRTVPLVGVPVDGDDIAVIGTRWGSQHNPAWSYNLEAQPRAVVERGPGSAPTSWPVRATDGGEYEAIMGRADEIYVGLTRVPPAIDKWAVPVFVLTGVSGGRTRP